jgi:hypothetical protein
MRRPAVLILISVVLMAVLAGSLIGTATAQNDPTDLSDHPLTGVWLGTTHWPDPRGPEYVGPGVFGADGSVQLFLPVGIPGEQGVQFTTPSVGTWQAEGDRGGYFTAVQSLSDATGAFVGTTTIEGHPVVSDDGKTFLDDGTRVVVTLRDAHHTVLNVIEGGPPVTGTRMGSGSPGFPEVSPGPSESP